MKARTLLLVPLLLTTGACHTAPALTPEAAIATSRPGEVISVQGTVFAITFDTVQATPGADYLRVGGDRWVLLRTSRPPGVTLGNLDTSDAGIIDVAFGLGVRVTTDDAGVRAVALPQLGDVVRATGTFVRHPWNGRTEPMLENLTQLVVVTGAPPLPGVGAACTADMDCADDLLCSRTSRQCARPPAGLVWESDWHDVNGACDTDADCPLNQTCDARYAIPDGGTFGPGYKVSTTVGRHLCVPSEGLSQDALCPRTGSFLDLIGGRYAVGKEVCIKGAALLSTHPSDGDTHDQSVVLEPLPYPVGSVSYDIFGAVSENSPPYKDPARPQGALPDPDPGQRWMVLGTYRYDPSHGWFEVHPIKKWWPLPP